MFSTHRHISSLDLSYRCSILFNPFFYRAFRANPLYRKTDLYCSFFVNSMNPAISNPIIWETSFQILYYVRFSENKRKQDIFILFYFSLSIVVQNFQLQCFHLFHCFVDFFSFWEPLARKFAEKKIDFPSNDNLHVRLTLCELTIICISSHGLYV